MVMVLMASTVLASSSSNWLMIWMFMEINTLSMCYILSKENSKMKMKDKNTLIYLILQILASLVMLLASMMNEMGLSKSLIVLAMFTKMGLWPTHMWLIKILKSLSMKFKSMMVIMTWQKLIPLMVISMMSLSETEKEWLVFLTLGSVVTPLAGMSNLSSLKSVMILSSVNMSAWMILSMISSLKVLSVFFSMYTVSIFLLFSEMSKAKKDNKKIGKSKETLFLMTNMAGLPPMSMFWAKIMVLKEIMKTLSNLMSLLIMVSASIFLYNYLSATMNQYMLIYEKKTINNKTLTSLVLFTLTMLTSCVLMLDYTQSGVILME